MISISERSLPANAQTILLLTPPDTQPRRLKMLSALPGTGIVALPGAGQDQSTLSGILSPLQHLVAVVTIGARAHLAALAACGIPSNRIAYIPGTVTRLPDGLLLAAAPMDDNDRAADKRLLETLAHALGTLTELAA